MTDRTREAAQFKKYVTDLAHIQDTAGFTEWEKDFISDMDRSQNFDALSIKQKSCILKMVEKYDV